MFTNFKFYTYRVYYFSQYFYRYQSEKKLIFGSFYFRYKKHDDSLSNEKCKIVNSNAFDIDREKERNVRAKFADFGGTTGEIAKRSRENEGE